MNDLPQVRLIALTKPVVPEIPTSADLIAYCGRVSNPANQANHDTAGKLINYLKKNQHWSPFEMAHAVIEVVTTRDIARQILRHVSFRFQEFSQRYAEVTEMYTEREARLQDSKNRQNSIEVDDAGLQGWFEEQQEEAAAEAQSRYKAALDRGIAKEQARVFLPEGLTVSRLYLSGSIRSWIHYVELRSGNGTQKEHREIAQECGRILQGEFGEIFSNGWAL